MGKRVSREHFTRTEFRKRETPKKTDVRRGDWTGTVRGRVISLESK